MEKNEAKIWNEAYEKGGNIVFYPHEEIVRFINRYIRKRRGIDEFQNIWELPEKRWLNFTSLDLGCGIGRHVKLLDEFHLNPYGVDISSAAVDIGKKWFHAVGKDYLSDRLIVGSMENLPYEDGSMDIIVSHGVLDSVPSDIAKEGIEEAFRVLAEGGLFYFDVIMDTTDDNFDEDTVVGGGGEKGTIQSYWTVNRIKKALEAYATINELKVIAWSDINKKVFHKRAHIICCKNKEKMKIDKASSL